jgi:hypothetical protein
MDTQAFRDIILNHNNLEYHLKIYLKILKNYKKWTSSDPKAGESLVPHPICEQLILIVI